MFQIFLDEFMTCAVGIGYFADTAGKAFFVRLLTKWNYVMILAILHLPNFMMHVFHLYSMIYNVLRNVAENVQHLTDMNYELWSERSELF